MRRVGWMRGDGKHYTRYRIPHDRLSGIEKVTVVRKSGGRYSIGAKSKHREYAYQNFHGADESLHNVAKGIELRRGLKTSGWCMPE